MLLMISAFDPRFPRAVCHRWFVQQSSSRSIAQRIDRTATLRLHPRVRIQRAARRACLASRQIPKQLDPLPLICTAVHPHSANSRFVRLTQGDNRSAVDSSWL